MILLQFCGAGSRDQHSTPLGFRFYRILSYSLSKNSIFYGNKHTVHQRCKKWTKNAV